jgi:uncharacterized membrane protein (UPF0127 family)
VPAILTTDAGEVLAENVRWASSISARTRGLLGRSSFPAATGALIFPRAMQVHTFGMRFPIDVIFCAASWKVLHVVHEMPPGRLTRVSLRARYTIELPAGVARHIEKGNQLILREGG